MAPGSNLEGVYAAAPSSSYNHYQQPIPIPASHNEQTPACGMTSAPQVRRKIHPLSLSLSLSVIHLITFLFLNNPVIIGLYRQTDSLTLD